MNKSVTKTNVFAKIGAVLYIIWGLLHFKASYGIYILGVNQGASMAQGRLWQNAFFLFLISCTSIFVAIKYNWKNNKLGYWINLIVVSVEDLLFIFLIVIPGYVPIETLFTGPLLWTLALAFSTIAIKKNGCFGNEIQ